MAAEYNDVYTKAVEVRIKAIENALDQIWYLLQNSIPIEQFNRINVIRQQQINQINTRITTLTSDVEDLESTVDGLL